MKRTSLAIALVVGLVAVAITTYWLGSRYRDRKPVPQMVTVIVSNQDIAADENLARLIREGAFRPVQVPIDVLVDGAVTEIDQLKGKTTSTPILANEQVSMARLGGGCSPPKKLAVSYEGQFYVRNDRRMRMATDVPFDPSATLPRLAAFTGARHRGGTVWAIPQVGPPSSVFVKYPDHVERWPMYTGVCA